MRRMFFLSLVPFLLASAGLCDEESVVVRRVEPPTGREASRREAMVERARRIGFDDFEAHRHVDPSGFSLPYRLLVPEVSPEKKIPLVLFLHGGQSRGDDNRGNLRQPVSRLWALPGVRARYPALVVVPQCPEKSGWSYDGPDGSIYPPDPLPAMRAIFDLIDHLTARFPVDRDRIYVTGLSMGGRGSWDAIAREPDRFAAALIVCGRADPSTAPRLVDLPIRVFHGDRDPKIDVGQSRRMVEALRDAGAKEVLYTEYIGVDHNSWDLAYTTPESIEWLFSKSRSVSTTDR